MSAIDILLIAAIIGAVAVGFAVKKARKKKGKGCCGGECCSCDKCE